ncbi:hypothetical protein, conserved [Trypanosoma brucei brucei TREU927]|uniref:U3 small nucleolar RNA-associated protein 18 n=1 Tax=Trypanosoma brucei brucei (strain 927/4 GUTat10.1) TaxID=185431 RepID=Q389Y4_TRYB2|nr:hypothetical protein, conserved [Trypanosoma brucei brucei TREU927]EAN78386.1 hypothetical protein, conserved [Trypanosoma brucei brucei TREU927]
MSSRAWVDEADITIEKNLPEFIKQSQKLPAWARNNAGSGTKGGLGGESSSPFPNLSAQLAGQKRFRDRDLDALLARTEPLLTSKHERRSTTVPPVLSVLPLPSDAARTVHWHRNGQLAIVGGNNHVYLFHAAGRFVEEISKTHVGKRIKQTTLTATGEDLIIVGNGIYTPNLLHLATEKLIPLNFLCTRELAPHRNGRRDNSKYDFHISKVATPEGGAGENIVGMAHGATITVASIASASIMHRIDLSDPVVDMAFTSSAQELTVATRNKLTVYDLRKSSQFLRELHDKGMVGITTFACSNSMVAVGSTSGIVGLYSGSSLATPVKTLKNLTTSIDCVAFGERSNGDSVLAFCSGSQKAGFRLASLPDCRVVPSFPTVSVRHDFVQSMTMAPTVPILSVGEKTRVTNYAL